MSTLLCHPFLELSRTLSPFSIGQLNKGVISYLSQRFTPCFSRRGDISDSRQGARWIRNSPTHRGSWSYWRCPPRDHDWKSRLELITGWYKVHQGRGKHGTMTLMNLGMIWNGKSHSHLSHKANSMLDIIALWIHVWWVWLMLGCTSWPDNVFLLGLWPPTFCSGNLESLELQVELSPQLIP